MKASLYFSRFCIVCTMALLVFGFLVPTSAHATDTTKLTKRCYTVTVPVALDADDPAEYSIYGQLCNPASGPAHTVEILIHGSTYDHTYWDWPYENTTLYSAVDAFTAAGYSTFNYDTIGMGQSSQLPSSDVTTPANAYILHELVQDLRTGTIEGASFAHVLLIGHSYGSVTATAEAATYDDVDGLVLTGWLHTINPNFLSLFDLIPANLDPSGRFANLDDGYLTTGTSAVGDDSVRANAFYDAATSDPNVIASDESHKETLTVPELSTIGEFLTGEYSLQITVPVFLVVGGDDQFFCTDAVDCSSNARVVAEESSYYSAQAHLQAQVIPDTGHSLNLHYTAPLTYAAISRWALKHAAP